jgi:hypothetical protein
MMVFVPGESRDTNSSQLVASYPTRRIPDKPFFATHVRTLAFTFFSLAPAQALPYPVSIPCVNARIRSPKSMTDGSDIPITLRAEYLVLHRRSEAAFAPDGFTADPFASLARMVALTAKGRWTFWCLWAVGEPIRAQTLGAFQPDEARVLFALLWQVAQSLIPQTVPVGGPPISHSPEDEA